MFAALQHRNFRLLWIGLLVSFSGSLMQSAAILWHVSILVPDNRRALALGLIVVPVLQVAWTQWRRPPSPIAAFYRVDELTGARPWTSADRRFPTVW